MNKVVPGSAGKILFVAAMAAFLATFNETYLNVAFASIMAEFGVNVGTVQWLAAGYMMGAALMVPVSAFAYRKIPTRPLFLVTVSMLVLGSVVGALAPSFTILLVGRIIQSLGTGLLIPIGMNITIEAAPPRKLGAYMGIMGAMTTLGPSVSIILAGLLLSLSGWRLLFWVFALLSLALLLCGGVFLANIAKLTDPRLDACSVALVGLALVGILYGVSTLFSGALGLALAAILAGSVFLLLFVRRQRRLAQPLIDLRPLASRPFRVGLLINMLSLIVIFAMNIIMPIFIQSALSASALAASLTLFPAILLSCVAAPLAGRIYDRRGAGGLLPWGFVCILLFTAALALVNSAASLPLLALLYIPVICGSALIIGPVQSFALSRLDAELNPHGVTVMSTGFQIAGCLGSSIFTGLYGALLAGKSAAGVELLNAASYSFRLTALLATCFAALGLALALYLRRDSAPPAKSSPRSPLAELMKKDVYTVPASASLLQALQIIIDKKISGAPVVAADGQLVGFISDGDILRYLAKSSPLFRNIYTLAAIDREEGFDGYLLELMQQPVTQVATADLITVKVDDGLDTVCRVLCDHHLKKAPVMQNGSMVGMINNSNITKYAVAQCLAALASPQRA